MKPQAPTQARSRAYDGYPYLTTKIERALHHILLLPGEWTGDELLVAALAQEAANRLPTCLVLGPTESLYVTDGKVSESDQVPIPGLVVTARLRPARRFRIPEERSLHLKGFATRLNGRGGYLLGESSHGGRPATPEDAFRLQGSDEHGVPVGLRRCRDCGDWRGEALHQVASEDCLVVPVSCICENHNLCAACGQKLSRRRLKGNEFDPETRTVLYTPGFCGLDHVCPE